MIASRPRNRLRAPRGQAYVGVQRKLPHREQPGRSDAVAPPPGNPRFPLLDGMRAMAAGSILVTHVAGRTFNTPNALGAYTARLNMGVAFFFVLSGFLLYRPFVAARFAGRRASPDSRLRAPACAAIVPAYWLALIVLAPRRALRRFTGDWWGYFGFLQNLRPTRWAGSAPRGRSCSRFVLRRPAAVGDGSWRVSSAGARRAHGPHRGGRAAAVSLASIHRAAWLFAGHGRQWPST